MRKLFSDYGLLTIVLAAGIIGIGLFLSMLFNNQNSIGLILDTWLSHLM